MSVAEAYRRTLEDIASHARACGRDPSGITLLAVSKGYPVDAVLEAYQAGAKHFGESRVQEALDKMSTAPSDIQWHLIGSLQRKKVPKVVGKFALIHSVDSVELAEALSKATHEGVTRILLQANTSGEASKHGMTPDQWQSVIGDVLALPGIEVEGLMTMAPLTQDTEVIRSCFAGLRRLKEQLEVDTGRVFAHLSMGMSHDYAIAIAEGATIVRIGTAVFS